MSSFPPPPLNTIDWEDPKNLTIRQVNGHVQSTYHRATGKWTPLKFVSDPKLHIHGLASGLNYGQQAFEGLKAFRLSGAQGGIALFRPDRNGMRLQHSADVLSMPHVPVDMFVQACRTAVALNAGYVPPYETGWSMYCRPLLFAASHTLMPGLPDECVFCVFVFPTPLGSQDDAPAVKALILDDFDRAAPKGTGHAKAGGNYAGVLPWSGQANKEGFGITLHLDSARHEDIDEFSTCGFLGVRRNSPQHADGAINGLDSENVTLVVPDSPCAIESLTSDSFQQIARSWGWRVEKRVVTYAELSEFSEVLGTGTAVGLVAIRSITRRKTATQNRVLSPGSGLLADLDNAETVTYIPEEQQTGGPVFHRLLAELRKIQFGKVCDEFGWRFEVRSEDRELDEGIDDA